MSLRVTGGEAVRSPSSGSASGSWKVPEGSHPGSRPVVAWMWPGSRPVGPRVPLGWASGALPVRFREVNGLFTAISRFTLGEAPHISVKTR